MAMVAWLVKAESRNSALVGDRGELEYIVLQRRIESGVMQTAAGLFP
jgi:hypothetical protein